MKKHAAGGGEQLKCNSSSGRRAEGGREAPGFQREGRRDLVTNSTQVVRDRKEFNSEGPEASSWADYNATN